MKELEFLKDLVSEINAGRNKTDLLTIIKHRIKDIERHDSKSLHIANVVKPLPIQDLPKCNRVEVIDQQGRTYVNRNPANKVSLSVQDEGRTLKVFID
jgi:hypothetical protein